MHYCAANNYFHPNRSAEETIYTIIKNVYSLGERRAANVTELNTSRTFNRCISKHHTKRFN